MKKAISVRSMEWTLIVSLALAFSASCAVGEKATPTTVSSFPESFHGDFIIRLVSVQPEMDEEFIDYVRECCIPLWNELRSNDIVSNVNVFELSQTESTVSEAQPWSFILVAESGSQSSPDGLFPSIHSPARRTPVVYTKFMLGNAGIIL